MNKSEAAIFSCDNTSYKELNFLSELIGAYVNNSETLKEFYQFEPSINGIIESATHKKFEGREALVVEIQKQYAGIELGTAVTENISLLKSDTSFVCVAAHQLNIFLGPLYYVHKILDLLKTVTVLNEYQSDFNFVPVFVLGSEDHDQEEINNTTIKHKEYQWQTNQKGAIGRYIIDENFIKLRDALIQNLSNTTLIEVLKNSYTLGEQYSVGHRKFLHLLFQKHGLIIVDLDAAFFKVQCHSIFKDEVVYHRAHAILKDTLVVLNSEFKIQAKPRDINLFSLANHDRKYIQNVDEFENTAISDLSPNVIMRPLMQQKVLPAVCFIGGAGELGYWLELKKLFDFYQIQFPVLSLRNHILYADSKTKNKLDQWEISCKDLWLQENEIVQKILKKNSPYTTLFKEIIPDVNTIFKKIETSADLLDKTLISAVGAEKAKFQNALEHLEKKFLKAEKRKNDELVNAVSHLKNNFFPEGILMERKNNFMDYYDRYGDAYLDELLNLIGPFSKDVLFLYH